MRGALALLRLELASRARILLVAAAAGLIPPVAALALPPGGSAAHDLRAVTALVLAALLGGTMAVVAGFSDPRRHLVDAQARPQSSRAPAGLSAWTAKLAAGLLLSLTVLSLVLGPTLILTPRDLLLGPLHLPSLACLVALSVAGTAGLVGSVHTASVVARSGARPLKADLAAGLVLAAASALLLWRLWEVRAEGTAKVLLAGLGASLAAGLTLAGMAHSGVAGGGAVRRRRLLSVTLWSVMTAALLVIAGASHLTLDVGIEDVEWIEEVAAAEQGPWIAVTGIARSAPRLECVPGVWLVNAHDHRAIRLAVPTRWDYPPAVIWSVSGRRALFEVDRRAAVVPMLQGLGLWPGDPPSTFGWRAVDLSGPAPRLRTLPVEITAGHWIDCSPDLRYLAVERDGEIVLSDLDARSTTARVTVVPPDRHAKLVGRFVRDNRLLVLAEQDPYLIRLIQVDPISGTVAQTGELVGVRMSELGEVHPELCRVLAHRASALVRGERCADPLSVDLYDAIRGIWLAAFPAEPWAVSVRGQFLADGRVLVTSYSEEQFAVKLYGLDGTAFEPVFIEAWPGHITSGEPRPAKVLMSSRWTGGCSLVTLETGRIDEIPAAISRAWWPGRTLLRARAACFLCSRDHSTLLELDPETLQLTPLLGAGTTARH